MYDRCTEPLSIVRGKISIYLLVGKASSALQWLIHSSTYDTPHVLDPIETLLSDTLQKANVVDEFRSVTTEKVIGEQTESVTGKKRFHGLSL